MSSITNYLNKIKTAVYGKDVRGAIHDAIKQVYDDASVEHDNANMEVKLARGTHNTLNDRLDNVDEIQAQTNAQLSVVKTDLKLVNNNYDSVNSKVNSLVDGSPKGVYSNLDALKSAKPSGDTGIYITLNDGKWNYWNGASWVSGGTYQSTAIGEGTITENMMAFPVANATRTSNLFNKVSAERGKYINEFGNCVGIIDGSDRYASEFIPILGDTLYTSSDEFTHYAFYNDAKTFIKHSPVGAKSFVTPTNARYVRLTVHATLVDSFSLEMGAKANKNTPYYQAIIGDGYVTNGMLAEHYLNCVRSSNLFNQEKVTPNKYIRWNDGVMATPIVSGDYYASDYIEIEPSTKYTVKHQSQSAFYDKNYRYVSGLDAGSPNTFTSPENAYYFRMTINSGANVLTQQMIEGETLPPYQSYYVPNIPINCVSYDMLTSELKSLIDGSIQTNQKINFIGDSITWGYESGAGSRVSKPYPETVAELLRCSVNNYGMSGSTIAGDGNNKGYLPIWKRYTEMTKDVTLNVVFAGTNDFGSDRQIELGSLEDTDANTSFYGGLNTLCEGLINDFPTSRIVLITPMQRGNETENNYGKKLIEYVDAIVNIGAKYSIPVIDLYRQGNMPISVESFRNQFANDGLHPNQQGYDRLGEIIANRIKNL